MSDFSWSDMQRSESGLDPEPLAFDGSDIDPGDPETSFELIGLATDRDLHERLDRAEARADRAEALLDEYEAES